jgi:chromate transporter
LAPERSRGTAGEVFLASFSLGCRAFGGPVAHLGYFERDYVARRAWIDGEAYAGIVALCQVLPGPTSSQVGFLVGLHRAGWRGALAAWTGFTLPSAVLMVLFALFAARADGPLIAGILHELKLLAVAVVAMAVWSMAGKLCPDLRRALIAAAVAAAMWFLPFRGLQLLALAASAVAGIVLCRGLPAPPRRSVGDVGVRASALAGGAFALLLTGLSLAALWFPHSLVSLAASMYHAGALVFGGGHVVLPLLRESLVPEWLTDTDFLGGYGAAQALPGPLFSIAAFVGAAAAPGVAGAPGLGTAWGLVAVVAIFLPGLLLAVAGAGLWRYVAASPGAGAAIAGVNAGVVGLLAAALYDPLWKSAVHHWSDVLIAAVLALLMNSLARPKR